MFSVCKNSTSLSSRSGSERVSAWNFTKQAIFVHTQVYALVDSCCTSKECCCSEWEPSGQETFLAATSKAWLVRVSTPVSRLFGFACWLRHVRGSYDDSLAMFGTGDVILIYLALFACFCMFFHPLGSQAFLAEERLMRELREENEKLRKMFEAMQGSREPGGNLRMRQGLEIDTIWQWSCISVEFLGELWRLQDSSMQIHECFIQSGFALVKNLAVWAGKFQTDSYIS